MLEEKKKCCFIGSHRMPVAAGTQDWCRGGGSCCCFGMFAGKTWPTRSGEEHESKRWAQRRTDHLDQGPSKADLTESI